MPEVDEILPLLLDSTYFESKVKRVTVYVQSNTISNDLTARTFPATDKFTIPNTTTITNRFTNIQTGSFNISAPYLDTLTT